MATFDMGLYDNEPIEFLNLYGKDYTIPTNFSLEFVLKLSNLQTKFSKIKDEKKQALVMTEMVTEILALDDSQQITKEEVQKFDYKPQLIIINEVNKEIKKVKNDPNFNFPSQQ